MILLIDIYYLYIISIVHSQRQKTKTENQKKKKNNNNKRDISPCFVNEIMLLKLTSAILNYFRLPNNQMNSSQASNDKYHCY